jgi:hypothetical protein
MNEQFYIWHIRFLRAGWDDTTDALILARTEAEALTIDYDALVNRPARRIEMDEQYPADLLKESKRIEPGEFITIQRLWPVGDVDKPRLLMQHIRYG